MLGFDLSDYSLEYAAVLPEQFATRHKCGEPIERLIFAVPNDAIRCYQTNVGAQRLHAHACSPKLKSGYSGWQVTPLLI
jgi:hypothetical protein